MRHISYSALILLGFMTNAYSGIITDPAGDTFGIGPVQIDIISYQATVDGTNTVITINFANLISPAATGAPNSIAGFVEIDSDRDPTTGDIPLINVLSPGPPIFMGIEYRVDLASEMFHPGTVDFLNATTGNVVASAPISFFPSSLAVTIPISGVFDYGIIVGTLGEPTDRAPNGSTPEQSEVVNSPEPASAITLAIGALLLIVLHRIAKGKRAGSGAGSGGKHSGATNLTERRAS